MRYLLECTYVFEHPVVNSGIQRVVRNLVERLESSSGERQVIPVMFNKGRIYRVKKLTPDKAGRFLASVGDIRARIPAWQNALIVGRHYHWRAYSKLESRWPFKGSRNLRRALFLVSKVLGLWYFLPLGLLHVLNRGWIDPRRAEPFDVADDDVLVLLDSSWHSDFFPLVERLKARGVRVVSVMYDLIPLTHPQFCDEHLVKVFRNWFQWIVTNADGFMAISRTIMEETQSAAAEVTGRSDARWFDYFYLGTDLDLVVAKGRIRGKVEAAFDTRMPSYLMVSTIEPRKNHAYLLDAFDVLWERGVDARLCIVGRIGWKCDRLIERIKSHGEYGKRLVMLNDLSDTELEYCYQHARFLVFPSFVEGFGLPLVEAMSRGLPVMASDIPVFTEIGAEHALYFDLSDPASLADLVQASLVEAAHRELLQGWSWISWDEAGRQFIERIEARLTSMQDPKYLDVDSRA